MTQLAIALSVVARCATAADASPGLLDPTFGDTGRVETSFAPLVASLNGVALQADGKIIAVGGTAASRYDNFTVARYAPGGALDGTFGTGGIVTTPTNGDDARAVAVQPDGKIVVVGTIGFNGVGVVRYDASGALDPTFGMGGIVAIGVDGTSYDQPRAVAIQPDGKIVVAGIADTFRDGWRGFIARFESDGSLDAGFGGGAPVISEDALAFGLALQADGKIVIAGCDSVVSGPNTARVARFTATGAVDPTFGSGGVVTTPIRENSIASGVVMQPDGNIVVAGRACTPGNGLCTASLARYLPDGELDSAFGTGGIVGTAIGMSTDLGNGAHAVALEPDGRIVIAGYATLSSGGSSQVFALARYLADGTLDTSFAGGTTTVPIGQEADAMTIGPDGAIVAAGPACFQASDGTLDCSFALVRYHDCTCSACETCDATGACVAAPRPSCQVGTRPQRARLAMRIGPGGAARMSWSLAAGPRIRIRRLGSPIDADDYALCVYEAAPTPQLLMRMRAPAARTCGGEPCWSARIDSRFFREPFVKKLAYDDDAGSVDGLTHVDIRPGPEGHTRMAVKGGGSNLELPALPLTPTLRVQLQVENGECWEATFADGGVERNDGTQFRAHGTAP